jgi:hypothetical protein
VRELTAVLHVPRVLVARLGPRHSGLADYSRWLRFLRAGERLERWPTRFITGHFVAVLAVRSP